MRDKQLGSIEGRTSNSQKSKQLGHNGQKTSAQRAVHPEPKKNARLSYDPDKQNVHREHLQKELLVIRNTVKNEVD